MISLNQQCEEFETGRLRYGIDALLIVKVGVGEWPSETHPLIFYIKFGVFVGLHYDVG